MSDAWERARDALEELEFDRATGKLSAADYEALRARYAALLASAPPAATPAPAPSVARRDAAAAAESLIARMRTERPACPEHGPRPEPDAWYCSECGRVLAACRSCGARTTPPGSRFCATCGASLAAPR